MLGIASFVEPSLSHSSCFDAEGSTPICALGKTTRNVSESSPGGSAACLTLRRISNPNEDPVERPEIVAECVNDSLWGGDPQESNLPCSSGMLPASAMSKSERRYYPGHGSPCAPHHDGSIPTPLMIAATYTPQKLSWAYPTQEETRSTQH